MNRVQTVLFSVLLLLGSLMSAPADLKLDQASKTFGAEGREDAGWTVSAGGFEDESMNAVALGEDGSLYIVGNFRTAMTYGEEGFQATGMQDDEDFFVGRMSNSGDWLWMVSGGSTGSDVLNDISVDPRDGSAYVTGAYCLGTAGESCSMTLGSLSEVGKASDDDEGEGFIARISSTGTWEWVKKFGTNMDDHGTSVVNDGQGNIYHSGLYTGMLNIASETLPGSDSYSLFVAKIDDTGSWDWASGILSPEGIEAFGDMCIDSTGRPILVGTFVESAIFETESAASVGGADVFATRLNTTGEFNEILTAGGTGEDWGQSCAMTDDDQLIIVGSFEGELAAENLTTSSNGWMDAFAGIISSDMEWTGLHSMGGTGFEVARSVDIAPNGEVIIAGQSTSSFTAGSSTVDTHGGDDIMLLSMMMNGTLNWGLSAGGSAEDIGQGVVVDDQGSATIVGEYSDTADFGTSSNTSQGLRDIFLWQYAKDLDGDGVVDGGDNCPQTPNPDQADHDMDGEGDACDDDMDGDGLLDDDDDCPDGAIGWTSDSTTDHDGDGCHDYAEDSDDDNDGIVDENDSCSKGPLGWISNEEEDIDGDGCADVDSDSDGYVDQSDNCPAVYNPEQGDQDGDGIGDDCDDDADGDGLDSEIDECPSGEGGWSSNVSTDHDGDGCRDNSEDSDDDADGVADSLDDCPWGDTGWSSNDPGEDHDGDGCRDISEDDDDDGDGIPDDDDECPAGVIGAAPIGQDRDSDGCNDLQEDDDLDNDGVKNTLDDCPSTPAGTEVDATGCNSNQRDSDGDGIKDGVDQCPGTGDVPVDGTGCPRSDSTGDEGKLSEETKSGDAGIDPVILYGGGGVGVLAVIAIVVTMMGNKPPQGRRPDTDDDHPMEASSQSSTAIGGYSDEQLMAAGWTPEQIAAHRAK